MASRIQQKVLALGKAKQTSITTIASSFLTFKQLNAQIASPMFTTENDAPEIGKGHEFATAVYPVSFETSGDLEKYGTTEFVVWAWAYALGNVAQTGSGPYAYTLTPINPGTTIELPYLTVVEQMAEGGGNSIDNAYIGCAIEEVMNEITYGAGRATHKCTVKWVGSGKLTSPSGVSAPALTTEHHMLSGSAAITINGVDYVGTKKILSVSLGWKNNLLLNTGFFPGSGIQSGAAIRGRLEIGARVPTFSFRARLLQASDEYTKLVAQTTGTAVVTVQYDANDSVTWTWQQISYGVVVNGEADGIVDVTVTIIPQYQSSNGVVTVTANCAITGIGQ
ncbi:MAG TPA: hypothetical protein VN841_29170 [Bryobacteraceae bacterium]|nr:hypothetical protein [Bryobacteraceae bacterium]